MRFTLTAFLAFFLCTCASAQGFSGGFRAGLNFVTLSGPIEEDADGGQYERRNRTTGFHVGATFAYEITDLFGLKADLLYSQKGTEIVYDDVPSYFYLYTGPDDLDGEIFFGRRTSDQDVLNSYIDIPITAYYKLGKLEIEGGVSAGFLVGSRVSGGVTYRETNLPRFGDGEYEFTIDGNYLSDEPGGASVQNLGSTTVPGLAEPLPDLVGAFYNSNNDTRLYNRLDFGLVGGLAYYLNNGLYLGARYQLGLTDVTKGESDRRITNVDPNVPERTYNEDDKDYTRSMQVSIGFRF
ncbi:porin family protein [Lewinella sp. 4G2]|uniref:porin family protein n=1 Tax=Lewinella sp. 4G2 TaxID=1803372 RepID=UPI0007B4DD5C|nr:porin family protein [Lewinella sp. 4G2]OAV44754.1 hypothetical protein A3850_009745 [Lewinella sp. 4G2]